MKFWLIVNLARTDDPSPRSWDKIIWASARPKYLHGTRETAEAELLRLQQANGEEFVLFEAVAFAKLVGGGRDGGPSAYVVEPITA